MGVGGWPGRLGVAGRRGPSYGFLRPRPQRRRLLPPFPPFLLPSLALSPGPCRGWFSGSRRGRDARAGFAPRGRVPRRRPAGRRGVFRRRRALLPPRAVAAPRLAPPSTPRAWWWWVAAAVKGVWVSCALSGRRRRLPPACVLPHPNGEIAAAARAPHPLLPQPTPRQEAVRRPAGSCPPPPAPCVGSAPPPRLLFPCQTPSLSEWLRREKRGGGGGKRRAGLARRRGVSCRVAVVALIGEVVSLSLTLSRARAPRSPPLSPCGGGCCVCVGVDPSFRDATSDQTWRPAEFKHISQRRKRN